MSIIKKIHEKLTGGELSCTEITKSYLEISKRRNPELNSYITITEQLALDTAKAVDKKLSSGEKLMPLEGIPMLLKDNISTAGVATTCASRMLENYVPIYDAHVWSKMKSQNAILLGKANMDEFAMGSTGETSYFGAPKNPHNTLHSAGGSSGGVASAVSGGIAAYGIGSDTGGSIRQPASFCGLLGLKPTYGTVSRYGLLSYSSSSDQIGTITSSAEDAAIVFDAICGRDPKDMTSHDIEKNTADSLGKPLDGIKIGIPDEFYDGINNDISSAIKNAAQVYKKLGAELLDISLPCVKSSLPVYYILTCAEASSNFGRYDGIRYGYRTETFSDLDEMVIKTRNEGFGDEVKRRIMLGSYVLSSGYFDEYYKKARIIKNKICNDFADAFKGCDIMLTPTAPITAIKRNSSLSPVELYRTDICTVTLNIAGLPGISVPCGFDSAGLPIGMQIIGKSFDEAGILNAAFAFERETSAHYIKIANKEVII